MIDHFTVDELTHMNFLIVSSKLNNVGRATNVVKTAFIYPDYALQEDWHLNHNEETFRRGYRKYLDTYQDNPIDKFIDNGEETTVMDVFLSKYFIHPMKHHHDIVVICDESENLIVDVLCEFIKDRTAIEVIDLNELFTKGEIGPMYIDRDEIHDRCVKIARRAARDKYHSYKSTVDGRLRLLKEMKKTEKLAELRRLGYDASKSDKDKLDEMLMEAWEQEYKK